MPPRVRQKAMLRAIPLLPLAAAFAMSVHIATPAAQKKEEIAEETTRLLGLFQAERGATIADIGAGDGEFTFELSRQLGVTSRIYSTDVNPETVRTLRDRVRSRGYENVIVLEGHADRTNLPDACCDAMFVRNVYHHFRDPPAILASIRASLKPGGRFAVIDFPPDKPVPGTVPPEQRGGGDTHGVSLDTVKNELRAAGFRILDDERRWMGKTVFLVLAESPKK
jgi:SAM-dependent methyltransferase